MKVTKRHITIGGIISILPLIAAVYAFGIWSGVMWVTLDEFEAFKVAQAQTDQRQDNDDIRRQRKWDRADYDFYYDKICVKGFELSQPEKDDLDDILYRLGYPSLNCEQ